MNIQCVDGIDICYVVTIRTRGSCHSALARRFSDHWRWWKCCFPVHHYQRNSTTSRQLETVILPFTYRIMH